MDLFDLPDEEFEKKINEFLDSMTSDELLQSLVRNGLAITKTEKKKWIDPIEIDTKKKAKQLIKAMERAEKVPKKNIEVYFEEVTDPNKIKEMFKK